MNKELKQQVTSGTRVPLYVPNGPGGCTFTLMLQGFTPGRGVPGGRTRPVSLNRVPALPAQFFSKRSLSEISENKVRVGNSLVSVVSVHMSRFDVVGFMRAEVAIFTESSLERKFKDMRHF